MNLVRAEDLIGLPVVAISAGEDVAEVRDVVYDGERHDLVGFTLNKRGTFAGRSKAVLPLESTAAIGPDALMIEDAAMLVDAAGEIGDLADVSDVRPVLGNRVLANGTDLGEIVSVVIATGEEPQAVGYEIRGAGRATTTFVPISAQMALSGENLVLPPDAEPFIRHDLAGFGSAVDSYRAQSEARR